MTCTIYILAPLDEINVYQNHLESLESIKQENQDIENIEFDANTISCETTFESTKILNFNIPYSSNWTLYVDGKEQEIFKVNEYSIGSEVEKGYHNVKLVYHTPFLKCSAFISVISWLFFVCCCLFVYLKKRVWFRF